MIVLTYNIFFTIVSYICLFDTKNAFPVGFKLNSPYSSVLNELTLIVFWGVGGQNNHATQNFEKCTCLHNNNTDINKTNIPVLYCLSHNKDQKFQFKRKKSNRLRSI